MTRSLLDYALARAVDLGAAYVDARVEEITRQVLTMTSGTLAGTGREQTSGIGVRVIVNGNWGFGSCGGFTTEAADLAVRQAVAGAVAAARVVRPPVEMPPRPPINGEFVTFVKEDPWSVPLDEKVQLLLDCDQAMTRDGVVARLGRLEFVTRNKSFASTEQTYISQVIRYSGAGIAAVAAGGGDVQIRSYPHCWQNGGQFATRGYELVRELNLPEHAGQVAAEAVQLLSAAPCPAGTYDIVLDPTQLALQIHESCGHPVELDRVLGSEASLAGTSFLTTDKLGEFRYGSSLVNLTADATVPGGLGTFGYDDEGVPATHSPLVQNGILTGYLMSRETAAVLGLESNGTMRADSWNRLPLVRMTNINLEPDRGTLSDLLADTPGGLFISTIRSWSIDDRRLNFQFGCELAYELGRGGRLRMLRNPTYTGITPEFWRSCDAICGPEEWSVWGFPTCGKGHPSQSGQVGHGTAPARFRQVKVGSS